MVRPLLCCVLLVLAACSKPEPPEKERPPEPQAKEEHTELRDAIKAPIDKAKGVEDQVQKAAEDQQKAIDKAAGG
ncbi:MAG TPA: hypothetical protein VGQ93_14120 [Lysobacter sp.]|jgi:hypothetical protein|nr:hypothetical protein [Lysobacter sp.]